MDNLVKYIKEAISESVEGVDEGRINMTSPTAKRHLAADMVDRIVCNDFILELLKYRLVKASREEKGVWTSVRRSLLQFFGEDL